MRCAIMQPTYLPWLGYFNLMNQVDVFILLDDVQFSKQSWQQRNRIKSEQGLQWITIPVIQKSGQCINQVRLTDTRIGETHAQTIQLNYTQAAYFKTYFPELSEVIVSSTHSGKLLNVNMQLLFYLSKIVLTRTTTILASEIGGEGSRSARLAALCTAIQAKTYISPMGSATYLLNEIHEFDRLGVEVLFHHYEHPLYKQLYPPFLPYCSAIDLILNEGPRARDIINSGRKPLLTVTEIKELIWKESSEVKHEA